MYTRNVNHICVLLCSHIQVSYNRLNTIYDNNNNNTYSTYSILYILIVLLLLTYIPNNIIFSVKFLNDNE